jgi:hypothetical protein
LIDWLVGGNDYLIVGGMGGAGSVPTVTPSSYGTFHLEQNITPSGSDSLFYWDQAELVSVTAFPQIFVMT